MQTIQRTSQKELFKHRRNPDALPKDKDPCTRYSLPKDKENWDEWWKDLAPSKDLHKDYTKDKIMDWNE